MSDYLGAPRFKVSELEGQWLTGLGSKALPGLSVTVVDRAYCSLVVRSWRSEEYQTAYQVTRDTIRLRLRREADEVCAELNAK